MREWAAGITVDEPLALRPIESRFPGLELGELRLPDEGGS
jgi:hypothetical protein